MATNIRRAIAVAVGFFVFFMTSPADAATYNSSEETHVRKLVNDTRSGKSLKRLVSNDQLVQMARGQAARMAAKGSIYHNPRLGGEATDRGLNWRKIGENVGMGPDADLVQDAFEASPHHYENIVDPAYNSIGIGVVIKDGTHFIVQVFANIVGAAPAASAPNPTVAQPVAKPVAPQAQPAAVRAAPASTPKPAAPKPKPQVKRHPNAVVGGIVQPADLSGGNGSFTQALSRVVDVVTFWA